MEKKVSIITITYNSEETIEETIKSVLSQDYPNVEYIIVDGASKDNTLEIVKKYRDKIDKVISEPDNGICDAFNKGIENSTGDIIGIINSDDFLLPGALKRLCSTIKDGTDVFYGNGKRLFQDGHTEQYRAQHHKKLKYYMALVHPATFITKKAYVKYGMFDLRYKACMDRELLLRMYSKGAVFQYDSFEYAVYRMGGFSDSTFATVVSKEREEISLEYGVHPLVIKILSIIAKTKIHLKTMLQTLR